MCVCGVVERGGVGEGGGGEWVGWWVWCVPRVCCYNVLTGCIGMVY